MPQPETGGERLWQVEARISLPRFTQKGKDGVLPPTLTPINIFREQCLTRKDGIEIWLRCDSTDSIASIQDFDPNSLVVYQIVTGQEERTGQDLGYLHPQQHPYRLVANVLSDRAECAVDKVIREFDLLTDILAFQLQYPVKIIQLTVFEASAERKERRECILYTGTPYYRIAKDAGVLYNDPVFMRIDSHLTKTDLAEDIEAGLRWFVKGLSAFPVVDKFAFYWIALEILVSHLYKGEKGFFRCQKCGHEIESCPACGQTTMHYPFTRQRIRTFVVAMGRKPELFGELWRKRQLFHGRVRLKDFQVIERIALLVSELKAIVLDAIKANLGILETEPPFSPAPSSFVWSSMWVHGYTHKSEFNKSTG